MNKSKLRFEHKYLIVYQTHRSADEIPYMVIHFLQEFTYKIKIGGTYASTLNFSTYQVYYCCQISTFKMTSQVALRTFLRYVIGISDADGPDPAASRGAIQQEYLGLFENLLEFDKDGIKSLYASVKKPGGKIEDPSNAGHWL